MQKHFVTFISPGTFFAEQTTKDIDSWDIEAARTMAAEITERYGAKPYAFVFTTRSRGPDDLDSKVSATSPTYFFGCDVYTLEQVREKFPDEKILISNMECNAAYTDRVAVPREGWKGFYSMKPTDVDLG